MFWAPQQISTGFASCLCYCNDVAHWRPTKLCTMFGISWAGTLHIDFWGLLPPDRILPSAKFTLRPSLALFCWRRYCTALQQRPSATLCGIVQQMELRNFRRGCHLYSTGRPSRWALAHILVMVALCNTADHYIFALWLLSFFSSPNLSGRRLDVYHTTTHGVALVRI